MLKQSFDEEINLKLRTLNLIHWTAIFGQFFAIIVAYFYFEISFSIYLCIFLITHVDHLHGIKIRTFQDTTHKRTDHLKI